VNQTAVEGRGHLGLVGQNLLVIRALRQGSSRPLPPNFKPLLGGMSNLRGFEAGHAIGDTLVAGSAELRMPLTSPLNIGKAGVSAFVDLGTVYNEGERLRRQKFERGIGGSAWVVATVVRLELSVARGLGAGTRVQFGAGVTF
jgi:hemolysin activation/secretion protein